ncbi:hypothetical protein WQE_34766 [Paraburkholderia hospita]|uniref:Uncharacterized protein n=1 Tax=Paraburkholderia hospita TaxID=169430 RepID=A0ABN0FCG0_9BURK|nr:hypothetical protein WQE_34766 [Paraburkholderia hospita]OUL81210.1 hypothetical protein CA602_25920 [Paraburkholderia hospita]
MNLLASKIYRSRGRHLGDLGNVASRYRESDDLCLLCSNGRRPLTFDTIELRETRVPQHAKTISHLANLLTQTAGAATKERGDDER